ncbi:hypothetical protein D0862_09563 [Hortaea werneckii]|uniref:Uncharacterized protein n=1 Tax=Hortaea werneckii TaxID=91943 RepID=A0A3M7FTH8_HORWE|nr:hypothetical protein D0862_09563 [Hortaea werneckii]
MGFQRGASVASGGGPANQAWSSVARNPKVNIPSQLGTITESPQTAAFKSGNQPTGQPGRVGLEPISWTNALKSVDDVDGALADPDDSSNSGRKPCLTIEVVPKHKDLHKDTTIHITGGLRVGCNEDITRVGKLTKQGYFDLLALWKRLSNDAQQEPWVD